MFILFDTFVRRHLVGVHLFHKKTNTKKNQTLHLKINTVRFNHFDVGIHSARFNNRFITYLTGWMNHTKTDV